MVEIGSVARRGNANYQGILNSSASRQAHDQRTDQGRLGGVGLNAEKLAKLTPHGVDPGKAPGRSTPKITAQDIAAAMGMARLSDLEYDILMVKYAGIGTVSKIYAELMMWATERRPEWIGPGVYHKVARAAAGRFVGEDRCGVCEGTGEDWSYAPPITCGVCHGHGTTPDSGRFDGVWQSRYRMLIAMLDEAEERALRHVRT